MRSSVPWKRDRSSARARTGRILHRWPHGSLAGGKASEFGLQGINPCEIDARIVIAAFLAVEETKAEPHVQIAGPRPAQMDHRSQGLFFQYRSGIDSMPREHARNVQVKICCGEFDCVA